MTEIPKNIREPWGRALKRAQRSISIGSIPVDVVEELIAMVISQHEELCDQDRKWRDRERFLERQIVLCGGGFDKRGMEGEPRGLMVQHGIHTVIEDAP
jgi:hypothetical protein